MFTNRSIPFVMNYDHNILSMICDALVTYI